VAKTPVSAEELQLKKKARRRLVGAIVLVLLVVVFVPMFLDREQRPQKQDIDIRIPPIAGQTQGPQPVAPPPEAAAGVPPTPAPDKPGAAPTPSASEAAPPPSPPRVETPPPDPAPKPIEAAKKPDPKTTDSYVIQVGAFSDPANARHLVDKLKAEKVPAYTEAVKTPQGEKTRVRAGPYPTLAAAETGRARLKTLKLLPGGDGKIVLKGE
jgi:DedD protein